MYIFVGEKKLHFLGGKHTKLPLFISWWRVVGSDVFSKHWYLAKIHAFMRFEGVNAVDQSSRLQNVQ